MSRLTPMALCAVLWLPAAGAAQAGGQPDPLVAVRDADPLEIGRVVERLGDDAVLSRLGDDRPVVVRLAAIRACPWLRAPEAALEPLAELATGRDSWLAPEAARSALQIARALTPDGLAARETQLADLAPARASFAALADRERARADIRRAAAVVADALRALGVPEPEGAPDETAE